MSSYKKLKAENLKLKQDIYNLVMGKDYQEELVTKIQWQMTFKLEDVIWNGSPEQKQSKPK